MPRRMSLSILALMCSLVFTMPPIRGEEEKPADKEMKVTFEDHIKPIFREKCGACHNSNDKKGGLALDTFLNTMQGGGSGEIVEGGDAGSSYLWMVVSHESEPYMPPNQPKLPDEQLELIRKWIDGGLLENAGSKAKVKKQAAQLARVEITTERPAGPPPMPSAEVPLAAQTLSSQPNVVSAIAMNPWSPLAAISGFKQVLLYNTQTLQLAGVLPFPEGTPYDLHFSRNGQLLLAGGGRGSHSGRVIVWEVATGKRMFEVGDEYDVVLGADVSPDQSQIALGGPKKMLRVFSTATGEMNYETKKHTDWLTAIEFSPDGVLLASGDRSSGLVVWEAFGGREFYVLNGHQNTINAVSWRKDSNVLASGSEDGTIKLWNMGNGGQIRSWNAHGGGVSAIQYTRDNKIVSTGRDRTVKLWDEAGKELKAYGGMTDVGLEVAFDSETNRVLAGDWTGTIRVWDAESAAELGQLSTNPPALPQLVSTAQASVNQTAATAKQHEDRIAAIQTQLAQRKTLADQAAAAAQAAEATAQKATAERTTATTELEAAKAAQTAAEQTAATADASLKKLQADYQAMTTALANLQQKVADEQKALPALQEAAKAAEEAAKQAADNAELANAAKTIAGEVTKLQEAIAADQKAVGDMDAQVKTAAAGVTAAEAALKTATDAANVAKAATVAATQKLAVADKAVTDTTAALAAAKAAAEKAAAEVAAKPEETKAIEEATAALKAAQEALATQRAFLDRLNAQATASSQTAAAN